MDDKAALQAQADKIRSSGILGQSRLIRLFTFLVECSVAGTTPKEAVIAASVFGKTTDFDVSQDSIVRVYIHNLRRKLDEFYAGPGKGEALRLVLPKGEYRLSVMPAALPPADPPPIPLRNSFEITRRQVWLAAATAGVLLLVCVAAVALALLHRPVAPWQSVRDSPVWSRLQLNDKPIVVVLGDYYIFGDTEQTSDVKRLIREFSINSKDDLAQYLQMNPELAEHYMDVGLGYLPTSSGFALANIMPALTSEKRRVRVMLMSALDPATIKSANIVYIGLLSGLGALQKVVFAASRFKLGDSFDELIDGKTQHHYFSGATPYAGEIRRYDVGYHDYGLFQTFAGIGGNQFVVIASTQDEGLRRMSEELTDRTRLDELSQREAGKTDFEALFQVFSMDNLDLNAKLLVTSPLDPGHIWTAP